MTHPSGPGGRPTPSRRQSRLGFEPLLDFDDVLVVGSLGRKRPGVLWPDFDRQFHARYLWRGAPNCTPPDLPTGPVVHEGEPAIFVSAMDSDFGHLVSSAVPRLPQSLAEGRGRPLVFTTKQPMSPEKLPGTFWAVVCGWFGIGPERLRLIHAPTRFARLSVAAQAEHLGGPAPPAAYLDLIEARASENGIVAAPEHLTYVSRAGLAPHLSALAGEDYLEDCLRELGVRILRPETLALPDQLRAYAQARHLVFAEGSALHGRQLLGRIAQDISVLVRRPEMRLAQDVLMARCDGIEYIPATAGALSFQGDDGQSLPYNTVACLDPVAVLGHFERLGLPIRRIWDPGRYRAARDARVLAWLRAIHSPDMPPWMRPNSAPAHYLAQLPGLGLGHLSAQVSDVLRHVAPVAP